MNCTELSGYLKELPKKLDEFSSALVDIAGVELFHSKVHTAKELNDIRKSVRKDIVNYGTNVLPSCITFVENVEVFFEKYFTEDFNTWVSKLDDIKKDVEEVHNECETVYLNHVKLKGNLQKKRVETESLAKGIANISLEKKNEQKQLQDSAESYRKWKIGMYCTGIGFLIGLSYSYSQAAKEEGAASLGTEIKLNKDAQSILTTQLIPALNAVTECLGNASQALSQMKRLTRKLANKVRTEDEAWVRKQYEEMQRCTSDINTASKELYSVAPEIESNLIALQDND